MLTTNNEHYFKSLPENLSTRVRAIVRAIWNNWRRSTNSDVLDDCWQEASILAWRIEARLACLPAHEREAYLEACIRRLTSRLLSTELQRRGESLSLDEALLQFQACTPFLTGEIVGYDGNHWELLHQFSDPAVAAAVSNLTPHEYQLLRWFYEEGLTDSQIATHLGIAPAAAKMQRHRVILRLRRTLTANPLRPATAADPAPRLPEKSATAIQQRKKVAECYLTAWPTASSSLKDEGDGRLVPSQPTASQDGVIRNEVCVAGAIDEAIGRPVRTSGEYRNQYDTCDRSAAEKGVLSADPQSTLYWPAPTEEPPHGDAW